MEDLALDTILDRIPTLDLEQTRVLHATWEGGDAALRRRAWQHGKRALADVGLEEAQRNASDVVRRWVSDFASGQTALPLGMDRSFIDQDRLDLRIAAAPALLDAILAALVGDELDPEERDELVAPWLEATGQPAPMFDEWMRP